MEKEKAKRLENAIDTVLTILPTLTEFEWKKIVSVIDHTYSSKAAKVRLDGSDINLLKRNFDTEFFGKQSQCQEPIEAKQIAQALQSALESTLKRKSLL
ncbi:hypothetical protein [Pectinatus frisingensis]|uniref:hypothetical protein n=1 Tax=Pectinatus frisingensis TaxID=865 RepID=UPI0018C6A113|nr:hypothetical protein [Pectinatus frisingensis]